MTLYSACCGLSARSRRELAVGHGARLFGEARLVEPLLERRRGRLRPAVAELSVDGPELLAQDGLALALADLLAHVGVDLLLHVGGGLGFGEQLGHQPADAPARRTRLSTKSPSRCSYRAPMRPGRRRRRALPPDTRLAERAPALRGELLHVLAQRIGEEVRLFVRCRSSSSALPCACQNSSVAVSGH